MKRVGQFRVNVHIVREVPREPLLHVNALQLCIRLSLSEVKCVLRFGAPFGELRGRYDVRLRLIEKRVALPGVMAKALRANINL